MGRVQPSIARIVIAAEHALFRDGLRTALEHDERFTVIYDVANASDVVRVLKKLAPDVLVIDLRTPGAHWGQVLRDVATARPRTAVVVLSTASEYPDVIRIVDLGVSALVLKDSSALVLRRAVSAVLRGACWIDYDSAAVPKPAPPAQTSSITIATPGACFGLTRREVEIVSAVALACTNRDIARRFAISETTVKHHLTNIFNKTGMSSRLELAMFALHHRLESADTKSSARRAH